MITRLYFMITTPTVSYDSNYGMGMCDISASWTETGKPDNKSDLFMNGLIPTEA